MPGSIQEEKLSQIGYLCGNYNYSDFNLDEETTDLHSPSLISYYESVQPGKNQGRAEKAGAAYRQADG